MSKHNLFNKKIKKLILYINHLIESIFRELKHFKLNYKKILLSKENRLILLIGVVVILTLSYILIPTFYNKDVIQTQIKNKILKNYNIKIKFNEKINYGLLPKPHFYSKNLSIVRDGKEIGLTQILKVYIGINKFFQIDKINMKDLVFDKTDFNIYFSDFIFFENLLKTEPNENKILFKKSNIFFKDNNDEILFINKIKKSEFFYDSNNLHNTLVVKNEVFNIPYKLTIKNDKFNKKFFTKFNSKKIRLKANSETAYEKQIKRGDLDILFINKSTSLKYDIKKNSLNFSSKKNKNNYDGFIDFKPFYFSSNFYYEGISFKNLFNNDSIFFDIIRSEILNNMNLNININLNVKNIVNINEFNNLSLKIGIEEGNIKLNDSNIFWKDDLKITLKDCIINFNDEDFVLVGKVKIDMNKINNFYRSFQINKRFRKDIEEIEFDFVYNLSKKKVSFDNIKVDKKINNSVDKFVNNFNSKRKKEFNKITFKNFVNNFFENYDG